MDATTPDTPPSPAATIAALRARIETLDADGLDLMFREARTCRAWLDKPVPESLLRRLHDLARFGPTSSNACPARFVFVTSAEGKQRLKPCMAEGNVEKTMTAPVTVIVAHDLRFFENLPVADPGMAAHFADNEQAAASFALRNSSLQGAYLMLAARALGLDYGPMSGFNARKCNEAFFAGSALRANFLCNLGYGDVSGMPPRPRRFDFDEVCTIV